MTTVPDEVKGYIDAFVSEDHNLSGMNHQIESEDGHALYCFSFWGRNEDVVDADVLVDVGVDPTPYQEAFDDALEEFEFTRDTEFEEIEPERAEYRGQVAFSAEYNNPVSGE